MANQTFSYEDAFGPSEPAPSTPASAKSGGNFSYEDAFGLPASDKATTPGLMPTIKRTAGQMLTTAATSAEDVVGSNVVTRAVHDTGQGIVDRNPAGIRSLRDLADSPWLAVKESVGQFAPQIGAAVAGGAAGARVGAALGSLAGPVGTAAGTAVGGLAGSLLPIFTQEYGGIRQEQQEAGQEDKGRALAAATAATALERIGMGKALKLLKGGPVGPGSIVKEIGKGVLKEGATEGAQNVIEQVGAFKDPTTGENLEDTALSAVMGGIGGGVMGGAAGAIDHARRKAEARAQSEQQVDQPTGVEGTAFGDVPRERAEVFPAEGEPAIAKWENPTSAEAVPPIRPSEAMGLRSGPDAGALEKVAAMAVDTGTASQPDLFASNADVLASGAEDYRVQPPPEVRPLTQWSDGELSATFRNAQVPEVRQQLAAELGRRRQEREQQAASPVEADGQAGASDVVLDGSNQSAAEKAAPADAASGRPAHWRAHYMTAARVAREVGIDPKQYGNRADLVAAVEAQDMEAGRTAIAGVAPDAWQRAGEIPQTGRHPEARAGETLQTGDQVSGTEPIVRQQDSLGQPELGSAAPGNSEALGNARASTEAAPATIALHRDSNSAASVASAEDAVKAGEQVMFSRSAMKDVDANVRRGRDSLAKALTEKTTVHRAMFRNGMGWVDFPWGDAGQVKPSGKTAGAMGLAHILEARQRKDGMSEQQVVRLLDQIVGAIASGREVRRNTFGNTESVVVGQGDVEAVLTRRTGSNTWLLSGWETKKPSGASEAGSVASAATATRPTTARPHGTEGESIVPQGGERDNSGNEVNQNDPAEGTVQGNNENAPEIWRRGGVQFPKQAALSQGRREILSEKGANPTGDASDLQHSFAGSRAETADRHALATAQQRITAGEDVETVRQDTGWSRDVDGKWKFEIDDSKAKLQLTPDEFRAFAKDGKGVNLGDLLDHPQLFAAYPALRDLPVSQKIGRGATYSTGKRQILMGNQVPANQFLSVLMHEVQHGIQTIEGFATGGAVSQYRGDKSAQRSQYKREAGEVEARNVQQRLQMDAETRRAFSPDMTADVAREDRVVSFNGKVATNAPMPANAMETGGKQQVDGPRPEMATKESVQAAVRQLVNGLGTLPNRLGRVVVATSSEIKRDWEPLIGATASEHAGDAGQALGFYDPRTKTVFMIADHIRAGDEMAVLAHELMHKHGQDVLGGAGWNKLHSAIEGWGQAEQGSMERRVYDEAATRVRASQPEGASRAEYSSQELFPYAVQVAMELGVKPNLLAKPDTIARWLGQVKAALREAFAKIMGEKADFNSQDLVNLAFGIAQRENPAHAQKMGEVVSAPESTASIEKRRPATTRGDSEAETLRHIRSNPTSRGDVIVERPADAPGRPSDNASDREYSRETPRAATERIGSTLQSLTVTDLKRQTAYKATDLRPLGLQFLGRRQLVDVYGDMLPELRTYNDLMARMDADKNEAGAGADKLAIDWSKVKDERQLAELMHDATLAKMDPAAEHAPGDNRMQYGALRQRYEALSPAARDVYIRARDTYRDHMRDVRSAIKERIERAEMNSERRAAMLKRLDDEVFGHTKGVYFPLARFGQYVVVVKGADGKVENVSRAETMAEADAMRKQLLGAFPADRGFTVGKVLKSKDFVAERDSVGRGFMEQLYGVLDKQGMTAMQRAELEDALGQLYLSSLPDLSWAKHGIHRKGTPGFSQDARRAFAQNVFHGASYLAKLRYGDQLQDQLADMQRRVDAGAGEADFDSVRAQQVVDEMAKRHDAAMNPKTNAISTALTSLGFMFHLGLSPASAMVNLTQTALVAYPVMAARWGFGRAGSALLKASGEAARGKNDITSSLNADEKAAFDEAVRSGVVDVTMAHDLAGIAQGEDRNVTYKLRPVMNAASFLFHHAEKFNRQVTFVAAYRLARESGANAKTAYEQAVQATYDGHFDYSSNNRPRVMQGNAARVLLLFKQYGQNMVYTFARNAQQSLKGATPQARAEARKALAGLLTMHGMAAGALGLPMVTTLLAAASMLGGSDDEPWDAQVALQNMLADAFGQKPAEVLAHGLSRLTPWDLSGRVALDKLIFPDVQEGVEGQRLGESAMAAALGPVAAIGINALKGLQEMSHGYYARGLETMAPSVLRGPLKAWRYETEGVKDKTGIVIQDKVGAAALLGQAAGFSPSSVRNAYEGKAAVVNHDKALQSRRSALVEQFAMAAMSGDEEGKAEAREAVAKFNEKNPTRRILPMQLAQSVHQRQKRIREAKEGVFLPRKRREVLEVGRFAADG